MAEAPTHPIIRDEALEAYLDGTAEKRLESYKALLRIPSISGIPAHSADCRATAEYLAADLRGIGMEQKSPRRAGTRSSTPIGCTPPGSLPCSSTATTTSSRWIRWISGSRRRSSRS
jgi:hypothetical protein